MIRIHISCWQDLISQGVDAHSEIVQRLTIWFEGGYQSDKLFACGSFLYFMNVGQLPIPHPRHWSSESSLDITHLVLLLDDPDCKKHIRGNHHYAFYIKDVQLYLSQYGNGGCIILSDLEDMQKFFETKQIVYLTNIEPSE
jgi:hypothetical protein